MGGFYSAKVLSELNILEKINCFGFKIGYFSQLIFTKISK